MVDCWGSNGSGDLGIGTTGGPDRCAYDEPCSTSPVPIGISATSLVADGAGGYCAILISTVVDCWGDNSFGELGDGASGGPDQCNDSSCSTSPVSTGIHATSLAAVNAGFCAILTSAAVACWGDNSSGELGVGTTSGPDTCGGYSGSDDLPCSTRPASTGISATDLVGGAANYCAVLTSGSVDCWGDNSDGELGNGSNSGPDTCLYSAPCDPTPSPTGVSGTSVAANGNSSCAILTSGTVDCWGGSGEGELGDGATGGPDTCDGYSGTENLPCSTTPVSTGISATSLAVGYGGYCAIVTSGGVDCWGDNTEGELGVGTMTGPELCSAYSESLPCSTTPVPTGISATYLEGDGQAYCAVLDSGTADCWGSGFDGDLGDASTSDSDVPVPVVGIAP
jgi:alpha-tubulin suppressor-like RCC1 family protein